MSSISENGFVKKMKHRKMILVVILSIISFLFFTSILMLSFIIVNFGGREPVENQSFDYRFYQIDVSTNISSSGMTKSSRKLEKDEFLSQQDDYGNFFLLSNFGTSEQPMNEYECVGSCFCDEGIEMERRNVAVLTQGIMYLVASLTSVIAFNKAKEFFEGKCQNELSDTCSYSAISSQVDSCSPIAGKDSASQTKQNTRKYMCSGKCIPREGFSSEHVKLAAEKFNCGKLKLESEIEYDSAGMTEIHFTEYAKRKFQDVLLRPFCRKKSKTQIDYFSASGKDDRKLDIHICIHVAPLVIVNPSIVCRQTYPIVRRAKKAIKYKPKKKGAKEKKAFRPKYN